MKFINSALIIGTLAITLSACGGGEEGSSTSGSGSGSSASISGTWINSRGDASWSFSGEKSGTGHFKTRSVDGGTCEDITIQYSDVDLDSGTFTYHATSIVWTGAYPAGPDPTDQKVYHSSISVNGNTAVIEKESFTRGSAAC